MTTEQKPDITDPGMSQAMAQTISNAFPSTDDSRTVNNVARHEYRVLTDQEKETMKAIKDMGRDFIEYIDLLDLGRQGSIAKTKMQEAVMWAVNGVTE